MGDSERWWTGNVAKIWGNLSWFLMIFMNLSWMPFDNVYHHLLSSPSITVPHRPSPFIIAHHQLSGFITIGIRWISHENVWTQHESGLTPHESEWILHETGLMQHEN